MPGAIHDISVRAKRSNSRRAVLTRLAVRTDEEVDEFDPILVNLDAVGVIPFLAAVIVTRSVIDAMRTADRQTNRSQAIIMRCKNEGSKSVPAYHSPSSATTYLGIV